MAADLKHISLFRNDRYYIGDDALICLSRHSYNADRMRRFPYERLSAIVVSSQIAWGRLLLLWLGLVMPITLLFVVIASQLTREGESAGYPYIVAAGVLFCVILGIFNYRKMVVELVTLERSHTIQAICSRSRSRKFIDRLLHQIRVVQEGETLAATGGVPVADSPDEDLNQG